MGEPGVPAKQAFDDNLTSYKHPQNGIPALFCYNARLIASNGTDSRVGTITAAWQRFVEWKRIEREDEPRHVSLETVIRGTSDKTRLLDLVENFTLFSEHMAGFEVWGSLGLTNWTRSTNSLQIVNGGIEIEDTAAPGFPW